MPLFFMEKISAPHRHSFWHRRVPAQLPAVLIFTAGLIMLPISFTYQAYAFFQHATLEVAGTMFESSLPTDTEGRTNILLLGVGGKGHAGPDLTDTVIVASLQPKTRSLVLLSLPRDLYIADPVAVAPTRINTLYSSFKALHKRELRTESGADVLAMRSVASEIETRLDLPIHGIVKVDFAAFKEVVDAIGGVDVVIPEPLVDTYYPIEEGVIGTFSIDAGPQHLDGETALKYARSRYSTSDFARSGRQQQIIAAMLDKVRANPALVDWTLIQQMMGILREHAAWTFTTSEIVSIAATALTLPREHILTMYLSSRFGGEATDAVAGGFVRSDGDLYEGSLLLPYSLTNSVTDFSELRSFTRFLTAERDLYINRPTFRISADTNARDEARELRNELLRYGFTVQGGVETRTLPGQGRIVIGDKAPEKARKYFPALLHLPVTRSASSSIIEIRLGSDYEFLPFSELFS